MKCRTLAPALEEIVEAALWFNSKRPGLGDEFWRAVDALLLQIEKAPLSFSQSEFATGDADIRFAVVRRFNYVVHFLVEPESIQILSVAHGSRRPGYWLRRSPKT